jgi:hypothetical protein
MLCESTRSVKLNKEIAGTIIGCDHPYDLNCEYNPKSVKSGRLEEILCWNHRGWELD